MSWKALKQRMLPYASYQPYLLEQNLIQCWVNNNVLPLLNLTCWFIILLFLDTSAKVELFFTADSGNAEPRSQRAPETWQSSWTVWKTPEKMQFIWTMQREGRKKDEPNWFWLLKSVLKFSLERCTKATTITVPRSLLKGLIWSNATII